MPVDFITATKQDLELEQQGLHHNLEKQEAYTPAQQVSKDLIRSLLTVKIDLENSYRFIKDCELHNTHSQKKQEFLAQINKAILETTFLKFWKKKENMERRPALHSPKLKR